MLPSDFTPEIKRFDTLDSTNNKAKELLAKGHAEGTVVMATQQSQGRGRHKRIWLSPQGGLYLSVILQPKDPRRSTDLPILAGAAVAQAVKEFLPKSLDVTVKWPNDCLVGWKKIAGVLCEAVQEEKLGMVVVGIGVNVNLSEEQLAQFQETPFGATSFKIVNGGDSDVEAVAQMVLKKLFALYELYHREGFEAVKYIWEKNCHFIGKKIEIRETGWQATSPKDKVASVVGTFQGLDEGGAVILKNQKGENRTYISGEITCFWQ